MLAHLKKTTRTEMKTNNMREIKFRGRRTYNKKWVYGFLVKHSYLEKYYIYEMLDNTGALISDVIPETVGQFTGLKDKYGVGIYEGDILQRINGEIRLNNEWGPNREFSVVVWEDAAFALKSPGSEAVDWAHSNYYQETEVVGNIHTNPELLNNNQNN